MNLLTPDERRDLLLSVGTHKKSRRLSPVQVAHLITRLQKSMSLEQIAGELGLQETSTLQKFPSLLRLPVEIHPLIIFGGMPGYLSFSVAYQIARLDNPKDIDILVKDVCENQRTKEEARAIIQLYKRSGKDLVACIDEIDKTRTHVIRQYLYVGTLPKLTEPTRPKELTDKLRLALSKLVGSKNVLSVAVNEGRFSFMLTESAAHDPAIVSYLKPNMIEEFASKILTEESHD